MKQANQRRLNLRRREGVANREIVVWSNPQSDDHSSGRTTGILKTDLQIDQVSVLGSLLGSAIRREQFGPIFGAGKNGSEGGSVSGLVAWIFAPR